MGAPFHSWGFFFCCFAFGRPLLGSNLRSYPQAHHMIGWPHSPVTRAPAVGKSLSAMASPRWVGLADRDK